MDNEKKLIQKSIYLDSKLNTDLKKMSDILSESESVIIRTALREYLLKVKENK